jgi:hypothetical protein
LTLPALSAALAATGRGQADASATVTAIAIERYRRKTGRWPERLDQLVPDFLPQVPLDPFDGQPLRYVVLDTEYRLYSVGQNGVDDGGTADDQKDCVFAVKRPSAKRP